MTSTTVAALWLSSFCFILPNKDRAYVFCCCFFTPIKPSNKPLLISLEIILEEKGKTQYDEAKRDALPAIIYSLQDSLDGKKYPLATKAESEVVFPCATHGNSASQGRNHLVLRQFGVMTSFMPLILWFISPFFLTESSRVESEVGPATRQDQSAFKLISRHFKKMDLAVLRNTS